MLDFDKANPKDPDASTAWVHLIYGATMHRVQVLEHLVAFLSLVVTRDPHAEPEGTMRDQFPATLMRWWRAYQKDAGGQTLVKIKGKIPDDLCSALQTFFKRRNGLAHRFFIEQIETGADSERFAPGTMLMLMEMSAEALRLTKRIEERSASVRASWPKPSEQPPAEFMRWVEDFVELTTRRRVRAEVLADIQCRGSSTGG